MVNADATNKWYNESEMKLDHIISAIGITHPMTKFRFISIG